MSIYIVTFPKQGNPFFLLRYRVGHRADIKFHIKSVGGSGPRFRDNNT